MLLACDTMPPPARNTPVLIIIIAFLLASGADPLEELAWFLDSTETLNAMEPRAHYKCHITPQPRIQGERITRYSLLKMREYECLWAFR